ncbi:hypothetical protein CSC94_10470 [Zhengella mangrovi]|uniref:Crp/Fnr family transcriptional regulator n=1 Tax=Zhengella mangrovi TaxID=1982044 RepID=A0A2G1QNC9_9HYPH|nr:Crp/Fnr family transcriptional regulator [Zhengella mangrovi]PHP66974.1 hypothetical protein CSC94_10470 [Zhengella mangrovi]
MMSNPHVLASNRCASCPSRAYGPCKGASPEALRSLASLSTPCAVAPGATIIAQGETGQHIGVVRSGIVKMTNTTADGRHMVVGLIEDGRLIGNAFEQASRFAYESATDAQVCLFPRQAFLSLARQCPDLSCSILETTQRQAEEIQEWLTLFNCRTTLQRLAGYLFALTRRQLGDAPGREPIDLNIPIPRKDLAAYLGTTTETLSRNMQQLSRKGILTVIDGQTVTIISMARLRSMAALIGEELQSLSHGHAAVAAGAIAGETASPRHAA